MTDIPSHEDYVKAKAIVEKYERMEWEEKTREADDELNQDDPDYYDLPCDTCGEVHGMVNPCCSDYDPLHINNCGYG